MSDAEPLGVGASASDRRLARWVAGTAGVLLLAFLCPFPAGGGEWAWWWSYLDALLGSPQGFTWFVPAFAGLLALLGTQPRTRRGRGWLAIVAGLVLVAGWYVRRYPAWVVEVPTAQVLRSFAHHYAGPILAASAVAAGCRPATVGTARLGGRIGAGLGGAALLGLVAAATLRWGPWVHGQLWEVTADTEALGLVFAIGTGLVGALGVLYALTGSTTSARWAVRLCAVGAIGYIPVLAASIAGSSDGIGILPHAAFALKVGFWYPAPCVLLAAGWSLLGAGEGPWDGRGVSPSR